MRILSGIQPSGALHLGNYYGMMKPAIGLFAGLCLFEWLTASLEPPKHELNELGWKAALSRDKKRLMEHLSPRDGKTMAR